ncbi:MAG: helix-turn-helix transcriptional regulator [Vulcanimicrobiota bacterium]
MNIGERIRRFRRERNWTQADLARVVGIQKQNISRYESGRVEPRRDKLQQFADAFDITVEELMGLVDSRQDDLPEDPELKKLFAEVAELPDQDVEALKRIMTLVVRQHKVRSAMAS